MFNIATGTRFSLNQIFEMLGRIIGFNGPAKYAEPRTGDVKTFTGGHHAGAKASGLFTRRGFEEGLKRTVKWYEEQRATIRTRVFSPDNANLPIYFLKRIIRRWNRCAMRFVALPIPAHYPHRGQHSAGSAACPAAANNVTGRMRLLLQNARRSRT